MYLMRRVVRWMLLLGMASVMVGCATPGLDKTAQALDLSQESVVIFSLDFSSTYRRDAKWGSLGLAFGRPAVPGTPNESLGGDSVADRGTRDDLAIIERKLPPGAYTIRSLVGSIDGYGLPGKLQFYVDAPFELAANSVVYGGHISIRHKERLDPEDQSAGLPIARFSPGIGALVSLLAQTASGMTGGTLDVVLEDRYDDVIAVIKADYPILRGVPVLRAPIPQIALDRNLNQAPKKLVQLQSAKPLEVAKVPQTVTPSPAVTPQPAAPAPATAQ